MPGAGALRYLFVVAAVLAVVIAASAAGGSKSAGASERYDSEELRFLRLINDYREDNGAGPLLLSDTISVAAERHSRDMGRYDFFGHVTRASSYYPAGSLPWNRMRAEGYDYHTAMGENIAVGCETAHKCFELWRDSPEHNATMLDAKYEVVGVARWYAEGSGHRWYWTTDFGGKRDPSSHGPAQDGPGVENGQMNTRAVWQQEARDGAQLILEDGYARLGDYDMGRDELRQKIHIPDESTELSYRIRVETDETRHPSDYLAVQLTDSDGERLAIVKRYTDEDAGGWRRESVDLSRFAGRTLYLSFLMETDELRTTAFHLDDISLSEGN